MKGVLAVALVVLISVLLFGSCGSDSKKEDDSWKSKTWDQMTNEERQKTYDYLQDEIEKSWY